MLRFRLELLHAVQVDENEEVATGYQTPTSPPKSELALQKGFRRRTWTGPAWLDNVTSTGHVSPPTHCSCCLCLLMGIVLRALSSIHYMHAMAVFAFQADLFRVSR